MPTTIIAAIAAVIILAGGGWYASTHSHGSAPAPTAGTAATTTEAEGAFTGSIRALAARGGSYACTMHTDSGNVPTDGTIYVSGEHIRGDFSSATPQIGKVDTHLIADGTTVYLWNSLVAQGIKSDEVTEDASSSNGTALDVNHSYTYDCAAWGADPSKFIVPTTITFAAPGA